MRVKRRTLLGATAAAITMAGCLGDDGAGSGDATVQVRSHPDHGDVLVGPDDMTLYMFDSDTQGGDESTCYDTCEENWPPLTVDGDEPVAGDDVDAELTTFEREDGSTQVAADGWPLYYFVGDEEPGDAAGQGLNDVWWVLEPDGSPIRDAADQETDEEGDATVRVQSHADFGDVLVGPDDMTLYMFDADTQGEPSTCYDTCEDNWPPLLVDDEPVAGDDVDAELTTFEREDGSMQVAADGWPLYYWANDAEPGDATGQAVGDVWWVLEPDGTPIRDGADATVQVRSHPDHGDILVGPDDMTLYMFDSDTQGADESTCYDSCEDNWPPLTVDGDAVAGDGVSAELTTFEREDGSTQVAADGWPLYYWANDAEPGDATGQAVGDVWWVLEPDGTPIRD